MGKGGRKYISLMELHNDEVEKKLIDEDVHWGYMDIYCCSEDDFLYYEQESAQSYFLDKNIDLVDEFNNSHNLIKSSLPEPKLKHFDEVYYEIDYNDLNESSSHPMIHSLLEHFEILATVKTFKIYFVFHQRSWSNRNIPEFDVVLSCDKNGMLYHRPSVFKLSTLFDLPAPTYADNGFKKMLFTDIERRPRVYEGFHDIEDLINNFENYSWMVDAITY